MYKSIIPTTHTFTTTRPTFGGTIPIGGWRTTVLYVVSETRGYIARCNCGWVDPRKHKNLEPSIKRATQHIELHEKGLTGTGDSWPSLQDPAYHKHVQTLAKHQSWELTERSTCGTG